MSEPSKPIRIALGKEDGTQKYFLVCGTEVVGSFESAAAAIKARERLEGGLRTEADPAD